MAALVDFVTEHFRFASLATLRLLDAKKSNMVTGGYAWKNRPDVTDISLAAPSLVVLHLSSAGRYPRQSTHHAGVGAVELRSWDEEFVFVLAHELRHIDQFWQDRFYREDAAELDAERAAVRVLNQFRKERSSATMARAA